MILKPLHRPTWYRANRCSNALQLLLACCSPCRLKAEVANDLSGNITDHHESLDSFGLQLCGSFFDTKKADLQVLKYRLRKMSGFGCIWVYCTVFYALSISRMNSGVVCGNLFFIQDLMTRCSSPKYTRGNSQTVVYSRIRDRLQGADLGPKTN